MQALVEHKGKQFLVKENLELKVPYLGGKEGDKFILEKILYLDDTKKKEFGNYVDGDKTGAWKGWYENGSCDCYW